MRLAMLALIGVTMVPCAAPAHGTPDDDDMAVWTGSCAAASYIADDAARTAYPCNALLHMKVPADPGHEMLIFIIKGHEGKQDGIMLSFGGRIDASGNLRVAHVQFSPGNGTEVAEGSVCAITREGDALKHIQCSATASDGSGRSAMIDFTATGKEAL